MIFETRKLLLLLLLILPGVSFQVVGPKYLTQNCLTLIRQKNWSRLSCRANIIRVDRRNLLKLINKQLGKHSQFIHKYISLHYYYLIVTFLYYQKCAKTHLQKRNLKKSGEDLGPPTLSLKNVKNSGEDPRTTRIKVNGKGVGYV